MTVQPVESIYETHTAVADEIDAAHAYTAPAPLRRRVLRRVGQGVFWSVVVAIVVLAVAVYVVPQAKAGAGLTVLTGSMQPAINPGDVVAVRGIKAHEVCSDVKPGDIVTFMPNEDDATLVTHRVVTVDRDAAQGPGTIGEDAKYEYSTVQTKGDNNNTVDEPVPARAVKAIHMYTVPKVSHALNAAQNVTSMRVASIGVAVVLFVAAGYFLLNRYGKVPPRHSHPVELLDDGTPETLWQTLSCWQDDDYPTTRLAETLPVVTGDTLRDWVTNHEVTARLLRTRDRAPVAYVLTRPVADGVEIVHIGIDPEQRNAGWGACALAVVVDDTFLSGVKQVWARHAWGDTASTAMFDRAGFSYRDSNDLAEDLAVRVLDVATWCGRNTTNEAPVSCDPSDVEGAGRA